MSDDDDRRASVLPAGNHDDASAVGVSANGQWWHYTLGDTVIQIIAARAIKRAAAGVAKGERKAVWFSCRSTWEPTATKGLLNPKTGDRRPMTLAEMVQGGGALARIAVSEHVARHTWREHRKIGNVDPRMADALESSAREMGADPNDWRVSYHHVPLSECRTFEASEADALRALITMTPRQRAILLTLSARSPRLRRKVKMAIRFRRQVGEVFEQMIRAVTAESV